MHRLKAGLVGLLCLVGVAGCTTNNSIAPIVSNTIATLQLSVGTVMDYGNPAILASRQNRASTIGPLEFVGAVSTFRNQFGNSAYLNPGAATLTLPSSTVLSMATLYEYGQSQANSGGTVIAQGINGVFGIPPAFNALAGCPGPNPYFVCVDTGYLVAITNPAPNPPATSTLGPVPPLGGSYSLNTLVGVNGGTTPYAASATLPAAAAVLPNPCTNLTFVSDAAGGGTFTLTPASPPAGVSERVVVVTFGTSSTTTMLALAEASGGTAVIPDTSAAFGGAATISAGTRHAFCIGTDFPWIEDGQPNSTAAAPNLTNGINGTSNTSVSAYFTITE